MVAKKTMVAFAMCPLLKGKATLELHNGRERWQLLEATWVGTPDRAQLGVRRRWHGRGRRWRVYNGEGSTAAADAKSRDARGMRSRGSVQWVIGQWGERIGRKETWEREKVKKENRKYKETKKGIMDFPCFSTGKWSCFIKCFLLLYLFF